MKHAGLARVRNPQNDHPSIHALLHDRGVRLANDMLPADNPSSDAFALLTIRNTGADAPVFEGWMIASSPALNALEHPVYDIWVLDCADPAAPPASN